jgi:hypothetical protein
LKGKEFSEDDYTALLAGQRISPKAVRTLIASLVNGSIENIALMNAGSQRERSALAYGDLSDIISSEEYNAFFTNGEPITGNLVEREEELFIGKDYEERIGSRVFGSVEDMAKEIAVFKETNPNKKIILLHGKWNGIPHAGYFWAMADIFSDKYSGSYYNLKDLCYVIICDNNASMESFGASPFLNTAWRVSMMSYMPLVRFVAPVDTITPKTADDIYTRHYQTISPDCVNIAPDNPAINSIIERCQNLGIQYYIGDRMHYRQVQSDRSISSSSSIRNGIADESNFTGIMIDAFTAKAIINVYLPHYGSRKFFS